MIHLDRSVRCKGAPKYSELPLEHQSIAIAERKVAVHEAEVLAVPIAQQHRQRQLLAKRLLRHDAMLVKRIVVAQRERIAIPAAQHEPLVYRVINMRSER